MIYLEMSRDEVHGGGGWGFPNCVWAPSARRGGGSWAFWKKVAGVKVGDVIIHLRGKPPHAIFAGHSVASSNGYLTEERPPDPGQWDFAKTFYRADLDHFTPFQDAPNLTDVFSTRRTQLEAYFDRNTARGRDRHNLFFVRQAGRIQCLNGAYFSDIDEELLEILLPSSGDAHRASVQTGVDLALVQSRIGQARFAAHVKTLYSNSCCFPRCPVDDPRFLVGAHIARWADNEKLRGELGNGLCLCLVHDRAFELGLFTLDDDHRIFVNPRAWSAERGPARTLRLFHGEQIRLSSIRPLKEAVSEHQRRVGIDPHAETGSPKCSNVGRNGEDR